MMKQQLEKKVAKGDLTGADRPAASDEKPAASDEKPATDPRRQSAKKPVQKPKDEKTISMEKLTKLLDKWKKLRIPEQMCLKLTRIYLGDPAFLDANGIYPMCNLYPLAAKYYSKHSRKLIELLSRSDSFLFICNADNTVCYGFFSKMTARPEQVQQLQLDGNEFSQIAISRRETGVARRETALVARREIACTRYNLLSNIIPTMQYKTPPSEDTLNACSTLEAMPTGVMRRNLKGQSQPEEKEDYGDAAAYFHLLNTSAEGREFFIRPQLEFITQRFHIDQAQAKIVLTRLVRHFLVPLFDRNPRFRSTKPKSRDYWLQSILRKQYYTIEMEHAFQDSISEYAELRNRLEAEQRVALQNYRPLSPFEWMNRDTGQRYYRDPKDGVIDLPPQAPARPSDTARWNRVDRQWFEMKPNPKPKPELNPDLNPDPNPDLNPNPDNEEL